MPDGDASPSSGPGDFSERGASPLPQSGRNPGAGCIIILIALLSLSFLVGFGIWNLFKLDKELNKFTDPQPSPTALPDLVQHAPEVNLLNSRIETFTTDAGHKREATLTLSPSEINLAIAAFDQFKALRGTFSVTSIENGRLHIQISFPLRGSPTKKDELRYLNGTMIATPELTGGEIILIVERVNVPDRTVPDGFIGQLSPYRPTQQYIDEETLGPWMKRLTSLRVEDGVLVLAIKPDQSPPATGPQKIERAQILRIVLLFGIVLVAFVGFMLYAAKRNRQLPRDE